MRTMIEVDPEVALKIRARARERGVSVDVYLLELIKERRLEPKAIKRLNAQERVRMSREAWSGLDANPARLDDEATHRVRSYPGRH